MNAIDSQYIAPAFRGDETELCQFQPRKRQFVYYRGEMVGFVERTEGNLCHYFNNLTQKHDMFIWKFRDGLNNLHEWV